MSTLRFLSLLLATTIVAVAPAIAADAAAARARMRERVSAVDQLKLAGAVGENNRGFLEVRADQGDAGAVVSAENADRREVFAETAARVGSTADAVGRAFAKQIAAASAAGVWVQRETGEWTRK